MKTYESRVTRLRPLKWEWAVDEIEDGKVISTMSGTQMFPSLAYQYAHVLRDHRSLDALIEEIRKP